MISRRKFLVRSALATGTGVLAATGYGFWEAAHVRVTRHPVAVPNLPPAFEGKTVAVLADLHHGPFVGIDFIREAVALTNSLNPDLIALVGDYAHTGGRTDIELPPCLDALSALSAPLGVFAVPGNHDMQRGGAVYRDVISATPLRDLTNRHAEVTLDGQRLWLAGVDDLWWGKPSLTAALAGVPTGAAVVLLSHNPDFAEQAPDPRVGLILSGHTHGGQVYLGKAPWVPSRFGEKYRQGLVQGPASQVFVSRGLGEAGVPLRMNVPPEVCLLTLAAG
ncbi:metallophosphoesterase [Gemmata sp.]|uniref:metallophosphoesterase n=1 Tax=Gemmata sp. TaxID=1914242 RepID=UPI003F718A9E